ncbi:MAG: hypothetical protein WCF08_04130 [Anaerolineaceae bacterium]
MAKIRKTHTVTKQRVATRYILRRHAERYILITLLSFALTVGLTRLFLYLTGYPQLGGGSLHIAHVLWGGLFLFGAINLILTFINQKIFTLSAILSGIGVGLFIDEVGKFITANNDYFFPAAAPIIYSFFLLTVLVYTLVVRRSRRNTRMELYQLLADLEEILDEDFSETELEQLQAQIEVVRQNPMYHALQPICDGLENYLDKELKNRPKSKPMILDRFNNRWIVFRDRHFTRSRIKSFLIGGLLGLSIWELLYPITFISHLRSPDSLLEQLIHLVNRELVTGPITSGLFIIRLSFDLIMGITLAISVFLFLINKDKKASATAYICLLFLLTTLNLVLFYFDQFSMIFNAGVQFIVLLTLIYYRNKYLQIAL